MRQRRICVLLILVALLLPGCAKAGPQPHEHTWENRKCVTCGEEKEVHRLGNWAYVLWEETGTMEVVSFLENAESVPFGDMPEGISSVQIADGITDIPDSAFWGCETLVDVTLPQTLRTIGKGAFGQCVNLTRINIPEGVTSYWRQCISHVRQSDPAHHPGQRRIHRRQSLPASGCGNFGFLPESGNFCGGWGRF